MATDKSNVSNELMYKTLVKVQEDLAVLTAAVRRIDARTASMDAHLAGFHGTMTWQSDALDDLRGRVEALEKSPTDDPPAP